MFVVVRSDAFRHWRSDLSAMLDLTTNAIFMEKFL
jgi:hypothetical protein